MVFRCIYVMGGADCDGHKLKSTEVFDVARGMWRYGAVARPVRAGWEVGKKREGEDGGLCRLFFQAHVNRRHPRLLIPSSSVAVMDHGSSSRASPPLLPSWSARPPKRPPPRTSRTQPQWYNGSLTSLKRKILG